MVDLPVFTRQEIDAALPLQDVFEPVRTALIAYSNAATQAIPIGLLDLPERAEVHVKAGYVPGLPVFAVKVATSSPRSQHLASMAPTT
jgi:ornithine cyclodeaminase/alanine dehydrogenase-like protein (mu-crystallin family)